MDVAIQQCKSLPLVRNVANTRDRCGDTAQHGENMGGKWSCSCMLPSVIKCKINSNQLLYPRLGLFRSAFSELVMFSDVVHKCYRM